MSTPEPLKGEKTPTLPTPRINGDTPETTGARAGGSKAGADNRPGGAADMAQAPDADGKLARIDTKAVQADVAKLRDAKGKLESAHFRASRPPMLDFGSRLEDVMFEAERVQAVIRRLDDHLGGLTPVDIAALKRPPQGALNALESAKSARDEVHAMLVGFPALMPPLDAPSELLDFWQGKARNAARAIGNLATQLGNQTLLFKGLAEIASQVNAERARKKEQEQAAREAEKKASPETKKEMAAQNATVNAAQNAANVAADDTSGAPHGGKVQADSNFVVFERIDLVGSGLSRNVVVHFRRGGKPQRQVLATITRAQLAKFEAGVDSTTASFDMASDIIGKLKASWARFDVDADSFEKAEAALAPAIVGAFRGHP